MVDIACHAVLVDEIKTYYEALNKNDKKLYLQKLTGQEVTCPIGINPPQFYDVFLRSVVSYMDFYTNRSKDVGMESVRKQAFSYTIYYINKNAEPIEEAEVIEFAEEEVRPPVMKEQRWMLIQGQYDKLWAIYNETPDDRLTCMAKFEHLLRIGDGRVTAMIYKNFKRKGKIPSTALAA